MFISLVPKSAAVRAAHRTPITSAPSLLVAGAATAVIVAALAACSPAGMLHGLGAERVAPVVLPTVQVVATR